MEDKLNQNRALTNFPQKLAITKYDFLNKAHLLEYGNYILKPLHDSLNLKYYLDYIQKTTTKITSYKLSDVLFYLVCHKIMHPLINIQTFQNQTAVLCNPIEEICEDDIYTALDYISKYKDELMKYAVKKSYSELTNINNKKRY